MDAQRLEGFALLASLTSDERARLAGWVEEREIAEGHTIAEQGVSGYVFYLIEDGSAEVLHDGQWVAELGAGDYFGEGAILGEGRRVATVVSTSPMRLLALHGLDFRKMQAAVPRVAQLLEEGLAVRLEELRAS